VKLLLDNCVWNKSRDDLAAAGHDVVHIGDWPEDPGDEELLRQAYSEARVLVTLDKDFGELAVVRAQPHVGIIRLVEIPARQQGPVCAVVLERYGTMLARGAIVTVEPGRVRVRLPEKEDESE
jgi:predicted nuclease of predicted toxin-antitoxin system